MSLVAQRFGSSSQLYDETVFIQPIVAKNLMADLVLKPKTILEIGCGTGGLSAWLLKKFPGAKLVLSDISPQMLSVCQKNIREQAVYRVIDVENIPKDIGSFDLIVSSLALQWASNLPFVLKSLVDLLNPHGTLCFSLLGNENFKEWRSILEKNSVLSGLHDYPSKANFPWPAPYSGSIREEFLQEHHENAAAFLKNLKKIGAGTAKAGHRPISTSGMRRILKETEGGFSISYHVLYGMLTKELTC